MVSKKEPEQKQGGAKRLLAAISIIAAALFLLAAAAPAAAPESSMQPAASVSNYTPAPTMNANVTWSTFENGWNPLTYSNGTANLTLNADMSSIYANPISINPAKISGLTDRFAPSLNESDWGNLGTSVTTGESYSFTNVSGKATATLQGSDAGSSIYGQYVKVPVTSLPSNNPSYDYFTIIYNTSGPTITGQSASLTISNDTNNVFDEESAFYNTSHGTQTAMVSVQLSALTAKPSTYGNMNITANSYYKVGLLITTPNGTAADTWSITLQALILSENPLYLGTNATGAEITNGTGLITLSSFSPNFAWSSIADNGYSVAVSQPMQNITEQQTSINDGSYTEQATYQGIFSLPTAPDLSYGSANVSVPLSISGAQYEVANLNGASYLAQIQSKTNGTFTFSTVNPNSQNSLVIEVKYTTAQWDASSSPPSFLSLAGIEYYWWVALLGFMGLIGLGSVAMSHFGGEEETLRVPKGKFGR